MQYIRFSNRGQRDEPWLSFARLRATHTIWFSLVFLTSYALRSAAFLSIATQRIYSSIFGVIALYVPKMVLRSMNVTHYLLVHVSPGL